jgi:hypothetical protein
MRFVSDIRLVPYAASEYGLLQGKRRLTRVVFRDAHGGAQGISKLGEKAYRPLLDEVFRRLPLDPLAPPVLPARLKAEWREDEAAFVLHGAGLRGFRVEVAVSHTWEDDGAPEASESELEERHGSPLPSLG